MPAGEQAKIRLGVDLGGTKIEILVLEGEKELVRRRIPTPREGYEAILEGVRRLVTEVEKELGLPRLPVGVASPGTLLEPAGRLKNSNTVCLSGRPLRVDLERVLARPVRIANDANCFALSEAWDGAARGRAVVFGVILGTGVGAESWSTARSFPGSTGSPGSGATTRCPGPARKSCPAPNATAEEGAAWKPSFPVRGWPGITKAPRGRARIRRRSSGAPPPGTRTVKPPSGATRSGWPEAWRM
ncbi:putative N-acetylglucosamine kinase [Methylacidimicrobium sp. AP8]|nr:putative N-acetylglucosamine kinase [Methylacidimicrobium sp. AP8]